MSCHVQSGLHFRERENIHGIVSQKFLARLIAIVTASRSVWLVNHPNAVMSGSFMLLDASVMFAARASATDEFERRLAEGNGG